MQLDKELRSELNRALSRAVAYKAVGKDQDAKENANKLVALCVEADLLEVSSKGTLKVDLSVLH